MNAWRSLGLTGEFRSQKSPFALGICLQRPSYDKVSPTTMTITQDHKRPHCLTHATRGAFTLTVPSRMITSPLGARRFSWQDRFCGTFEAGCGHVDPSSQASHCAPLVREQWRGRRRRQRCGRRSRPVTSLPRFWRRASARPSRPSANGNTAQLFMTAATRRTCCKVRRNRKRSGGWFSR